MATYSLPPLLTDRIDAVNSLLQSIGEAPVDSVELSQAADVQAADKALTEIQRSVLGRGWHFNREYNLSLSPDVNGEIALPANCQSVSYAYLAGSFRGSPVAITERGRKLYDLENHTFAIGKSIAVDMILALEWEEMPEYARAYITIRAAQLFQARLQGSRVVQAVQADEVMMNLVTLEQREDAADPQNQITGNIETLYRLYGRLLRRRW